MSAILDLSSAAAASTAVTANSTAPAQTPARKGARSAKRTKSIASVSTSTSTFTPVQPSPIMPPSHSRAKTVSHIDLVNQGKRLSLQFPIQPAAGSSSPIASPPATRPQSWIGTPSSARAVPSPSDVNILAVLAAQERFVLELKEELTKAEADLQILKKHYLNHEVNKIRNEIRKVAPLQPLNTVIANSKPDNEHDEDPALTTQREADRKKALLNNAVKTPQRKVFSGSRQLRTLSLLSPDKNYTPSFPQPLDLLDDEPVAPRPAMPAHSFTSPDVRKSVNEDVNDNRFDLGPMQNIQREKLIRASTQIATGFKNSLFTFIEDIKSATVGDEAINGIDRNSPTAAAAAAKAASAKSIRKGSDGRPLAGRTAGAKVASPKTGSAGDDFWAEHGLTEPKSNAAIKYTPKSIQTPQKQVSKPVDEDEDWITWDTPQDNHNSSDDSDGAASPGSSRTSTSSAGHPDEATSRDAKRDMSSWSDLAKLSPVNIKQKASHLMKEWEKQLTPPPESRTGSHAHGDYLGRSSSPPSLI